MTLFSAANRTFSIKNIKPFLPLLVYVAAVFLIAAIYVSSFRQIETLIRDEKMHGLGAVADMKAGQIAAWRDTERRTAEAFSRDSLLAAEFGQWLREGAPANGRRQRLQQMLAELHYVHGYKALILLDRQGVVRLSLLGAAALGTEETWLAKRAMDDQEVLLSDFHRNTYGDQGISIDLIAPLIDVNRVLGSVVLEIDPYTYLYPLIRSWPIESASAETLLVRREGNDVLFLNDVRHKSGTALTLRMPLDTADLPSAMAVHGILGAADGSDYRGVPVVAETRPVAGTPWFVVSKIDRDELFAPVKQLKEWSANLGLAFAVVGGLLVLSWVQGHRARLRSLRLQHSAELERRVLVRHFDYLSKYANDIIMLADEACHIVEANDRAQQAYGYTRDELLRMRIPELRDPAEDPAVFRRQLAQLKQSGELCFETVNVRKDGTRFPVESSARVIEVEGKKYLQGVIRDISERKQAEDALRRSETLLKKSQQMAHIGSWELDLKNNILYWSDENYRIFEVDPAGFGATYEAFLDRVHPDDREKVNQAYLDSVRDREHYSIIHRLQLEGQRVKFVQEWCETYYDEGGRPLRSIGTAQDVTQQQSALDTLSKSARQIRELYNNAPCGYHSLDRGGFIIQINDTELQWLGYTRDEVVGKMNFADLLAPGSRQTFRDNFSGFMQRGFVHDLEYELVRKDGTSFFALLNATALYDADGDYLMSRSTLFDITARKRAEDELRLQGAILSQMEGGVALVRADAGTIVYANPKFEQMFGYAAGELIGQHVSQLNAPATKSPEETALEIMAALKEQGQWEGEIANQKKDGSIFWCQASVSTFEHHRYGTVWVSTHQDITASKLAEKRLEESEERFRAMADSAPIMIWIADVQEQADCYGCQGCNYFNRRWYEFTGLPPERRQGCEWQGVIHDEDKERFAGAYRDAFQNGQPFNLEYRLRRHDGVFRWVRDSGVPRYSAGGRLLGFIGTSLDVTDRKLFEALRADMEHAGRLQVAGEMASGLAHELSQPISAASNYLSAGLRLIAERDWDRVLKTVELARTQTERAGEIINHLKEMVRKQAQERAMLDINSLIRDTVRFMEFEIRQKSVSVLMDLYELPLTRASKIEIEQVLINLIKNAIDSMSSTPQKVLRITTRFIESGFILVSVKDTGKGVAPDELDTIFNPFQTSKKDGLGLGLPICRSLVENHGGQIWAEPHGDEGAELYFTLPVEVIYA